MLLQVVASCCVRAEGVLLGVAGSDGHVGAVQGDDILQGQLGEGLS